MANLRFGPLPIFVIFEHVWHIKIHVIFEIIINFDIKNKQNTFLDFLGLRPKD